MKFKTITKNTSAEIIEKKSKFIANVFYVENDEEIDAYIYETKNKYKDAKHNCYAYNLISGISKCTDDGEPTGTAGSPILNTIIKNDLSNVLIIVTRYFGGILLGTGGLTRAYTEASIKALKNTETQFMTEGYEINLNINYNELEKIKYICKKENITINKINYLDNIEIDIEISEKIKNEIVINNNIYGVKILNYDILRQKYIIVK